MAAFFLGVVLFYIYRDVSKKMLGIVSGVVLGFLIMAAMVDFKLFYDDQWGIFTFIMFPSILFLALLAEERISFRKVRILGAVSFEMYLWHIPALVLLQTANAVTKVSYSRSAMILFAAVVTGWASLVYQMLEKPLSQWLEARRKRK